MSQIELSTLNMYLEETRINTDSVIVQSTCRTCTARVQTDVPCSFSAFVQNAIPSLSINVCVNFSHPGILRKGMLFQQIFAMHYELVGGNIVPILSLEAHK